MLPRSVQPISTAQPNQEAIAAVSPALYGRQQVTELFFGQWTFAGIAGMATECQVLDLGTSTARDRHAMIHVRSASFFARKLDTTISAVLTSGLEVVFDLIDRGYVGQDQADFLGAGFAACPPLPRKFTVVHV